MQSEVESFEQSFAARFGFPGALAVGFGRSALFLALDQYHVAGRDVVVPDFSCAQIAQAVRAAGGRPVFYPVERDLSVQPCGFLAAMTENSAAAIAIHYFGRPLPALPALAALCRQRQIPLIEDCALALGTPGAGNTGDAVVFSLTKSDWCYGGGLLASCSSELLLQSRRRRDESFIEDRELALLYGSFCLFDYAANRPSCSSWAERAGRALIQRAPHFPQNFYDAGRFDALMTDFAARTAVRMMLRLDEEARARRETSKTIHDTLRGCEHILFRQPSDEDSGAFLLLCSPAGRVERWVKQAAEEGITLRRCWPAYQEREGGQGSEVLDWLARSLLILEVHPQLEGTEIQNIAGFLKNRAAEE